MDFFASATTAAVGDVIGDVAETVAKAETEAPARENNSAEKKYFIDLIYVSVLPV